MRTLYVHFANRQDQESFAQLVGQQITDRTKFIWWPEVAVIEVMGKMRYVEGSADA